MLENVIEIQKTREVSDAFTMKHNQFQIHGQAIAFETYTHNSAE